MRSFRGRILTALFFCLISIGQAYPYSLAFAMNHEAQCYCNLHGRKCIHGCDLKKHRHGHHHSQMGVTSANAPEKSLWVSPRCAGQNQRESLSFQGDPFLPMQFHLRSVPSAGEQLESIATGFHEWILACEDPPPKE